MARERAAERASLQYLFLLDSLAVRALWGKPAPQSQAAAALDTVAQEHEQTAELLLAAQRGPRPLLPAGAVLLTNSLWLAQAARVASAVAQSKKAGSAAGPSGGQVLICKCNLGNAAPRRRS